MREYFIELDGRIRARVTINSKTIRKLKKAGYIVHPVYS